MHLYVSGATDTENNINTNPIYVSYTNDFWFYNDIKSVYNIVFKVYNHEQCVMYHVNMYEWIVLLYECKVKYMYTNVNEVLIQMCTLRDVAKMCILWYYSIAWTCVHYVLCNEKCGCNEKRISEKICNVCIKVHTWPTVIRLNVILVSVINWTANGINSTVASFRDVNRAIVTNTISVCNRPPVYTTVTNTTRLISWADAKNGPRIKPLM